MSMLPSSRPDVDAEQEGEIRLLGLEDESVDEVLDAISSETARTIIARIHDEPHTPSELAAATDVSVQNVSYHLEKLENADLVRVAGTQYSEKGREMKVYAPAEEPLVMFVGTDERRLGLRELLTRFLGATALLAAASVLLHAVVEGSIPYVSFTAAGSPGTGDAGTLPLATAVFLGGVAVLAVAFAWRYRAAELEGVLARIRARPTLGGRDPGRSSQVAAVAAGTFLLAAGAWGAAASLGVSLPGVGPLGPALLLVGAAAVQAYDNDGLLVSWLVVFAPIAGVAIGVLGVGLARDGLHTVAGILGYAVILGVVAALVFGTGGFLIGAGGRRLVAWISETN